MLMLFSLISFSIAVSINAAAQAPAFVFNNNWIPKKQWDENQGYCGELSLILAGMNLAGQYMSQFEMRRACFPDNTTTPNKGYTVQYKKQMLVEANSGHSIDKICATHARLKHEKFQTDDGPNSDKEFLVQVKQRVLKSQGVIFGLLNNFALINDSVDPNVGQLEYDHIVLAVGIKSNHDLSDQSTWDQYYDDDELIITDHGEYPSDNPQFIFSFPFSQLPQTRQGANSPTSLVYSLATGFPHYGIAITGADDSKSVDSQLLPLRLYTSILQELPEVVEGTGIKPTGSPMTITLEARCLTVDQDYHCAKFKSLAHIPNDITGHLESLPAHLKLSFTATSSIQNITTFSHMTDETVIFRCLPVVSTTKRKLTGIAEEQAGSLRGSVM